MSAIAAQAAAASLTSVQSRVISLQQRIAALTGAPLAASASTSTSSTFASTLSVAQSQLDDASGGSSASGSASGADVVADAKKYLGVPYAWGGTDPEKGLDCSGFTQLVMKENGTTLPRTAAQQARVGTEVPSLDQARPGDLVVLENGTHIGIYVGDGQMIHAPKAGDVVKISKVWETPMTIRRVTGDAAGGSTPALSATLRASVLGTSAATSAGAPTSASRGAAAFQGLFDAAESRYGLPDGLLSAVAKTESGYDPTAVSPAGARGLMQIMPGTARELGVDAGDPAQAVDGAARLLAKHLDRFGSLQLALAAYNAGPGNVTKHGGVPPFAETQSYVRKVAAAMAAS